MLDSGPASSGSVAVPAFRQTVLIVDDSAENLTVLADLLREHYKVLAANSGMRALQLATREPAPDIVLLDVMMPRMSGYEVLSRLRSDAATRDIPVIFTTAMNATEDEAHGLALGAVDYITKPLRPAIVLARVLTHLELKLARDRLRSVNRSLEDEVARRVHESHTIQDVALRALMRLAETRDIETGNHILRTQEYVRVLARRVCTHPRFAAELDEHRIMLIAKSAPLHDIGKVGIPDRVLLKPGRLTPEECPVMKTHARIGADAIKRAESDTHEVLPFLVYAKQLALHHHERWDGAGYPGGLAGDAIPLAARLMALADVFDALISARVYMQPMSFEQARDVLAAERGRHFDPDLLDAFLLGFDDFCAIARRLGDARQEISGASAADPPEQ